MKGVGRPECESNIIRFVCQTTHCVACGESIARRQTGSRKAIRGNGSKPGRKDVDLNEFGGVRI